METSDQMDLVEKATKEALRVDFLGIPKELIIGKRIVVWRYALDERGDLKKPPFDPRTGDRADVTDPATWGYIDDAINAYRLGSYAGIGIVLTDKDHLVALDFDDCIEGDVITDPDIEEFIKLLPTYYERSPGKRGIRGFVYGTIPGSRTRAGKKEIYANARYVTLTGHPLPFSQEHIAINQEGLNRVYNRLFPQKRAAMQAAQVQRRPLYKDRFSLEEKVEHWKQNEMFRRYFEGDKSLWGKGGVHNSKSEADYKLCLLIVYRAGKDAAMVDTIYRMSKLYDDKWDRAAGKGKTYGQLIVEKAVAMGRTAR